MPQKDLGPTAQKLGIVFALPIEAHAFEQRVRNTIQYQASNLVIFEGTCNQQQVLWTISGIGRHAATNAAHLLISGHHPDALISVGFAGGLSPDLNHGAIVIPENLLSLNNPCAELPPCVELPFAGSRFEWPESLSVTRATTLVTVDAVVDSLEKKKKLREETSADLVDMESAAVALVARENSIGFLAIRAISDTSEETLPPEVSRLSQPQSSMHRLGATLAAITRRPRAVTDLWKLWEQSLRCSRALADELEQIARAIH
jgi:adenosylhomocysteine nucleosidase